MGWSAILFIAVGLSMDAFAVSISSGSRGARSRLLWNALLLGACFGAFQAIMPVLGWAAGLGLRRCVESCDHWIAFTILTALGCKMIYEAFHHSHAGLGKREFSPTVKLLLTLSVATSIDALAVGFTFSALNVAILAPVLIIGAVTFVISSAGVAIGHKCGEYFGDRFEFAGGVILIAIGVKIILSHLMAGS